MKFRWYGFQYLSKRTFTCGHCQLVVGSNQGYCLEDTLSHGNPNRQSSEAIYICPSCEKPSYFNGSEQIPGPLFGSEVEHVPMDINALYHEARNCMTVSSFTACVLLCRKLLMGIAVDCGATPGESFQFYVNYLHQNGFIPLNARGWVDHIRTKGNEANHQIRLMTRADAEELLILVEMLLKLIFEFPHRVSTP